jgi:hypothetical protein
MKINEAFSCQHSAFSLEVKYAESGWLKVENCIILGDKNDKHKKSNQNI